MTKNITIKLDLIPMDSEEFTEFFANHLIKYNFKYEISKNNPENINCDLLKLTGEKDEIKKFLEFEYCEDKEDFKFYLNHFNL